MWAPARQVLGRFEAAGVPMGLLAAHWCLPLFSMTLPACTLYRPYPLDGTPTYAPVTRSSRSASRSSSARSLARSSRLVGPLYARRGWCACACADMGRGGILDPPGWNHQLG